MNPEPRLPLALLLLRVSVFFVMFMWTIDKFIQPEHGAKIIEKFYFLPGVGAPVMFAIGALELALLVAFVIGFARKWSYGLVLAIHAVSTLSSWQKYLHPSEYPNLLFFAAWPMLAACLALFLLRESDTLLTVPSRR